MTDLSNVPTPELIGELEGGRGYEVFPVGFVLDNYDTDALVAKLHERGHYYRQMDDESLTDEMEARGYHVSRKDKDKEILHDIYRHAKWMTGDQLKDYLNDLFIKYLEKWL